MSNSAFIKSSIAKKYWMALTGLFLCLFLVGHLLGNLQLIFSTGEEGRRVFNEYAYFMTHNPAIKVLSYLTYFSILFHAIDGIALFVQNKKARPVAYAYSKPSANSSIPSRYMALLGTLVLVFIATHMSNFWWKMKYTEEIPLHSYFAKTDKDFGDTTYAKVFETKEFYYSQTGPIPKDTAATTVKGLDIMVKGTNLKYGSGFKDLHTVVLQYFSKQNKSESGIPVGLLGTIFYVFSMAVLSFHLWHGFASAFQSLGLNHPTYTPLIKTFGRAFSVVVPGLFAIIPVFLYLIS
ncbi:MAG: succinate dehydrogenase cytochrome b subunit [Crocinitomicaceae bacterium]|jgi:succinate dehydrogenase / fumarate reductase cytochrome b subunit|nr:succinate dehydrogenase cytochrome b subunit [Crocinitomicaceae bacterium]